METVLYSDFEKLEIRTGTIIDAKEFPEARKPAYQLFIDFGEWGIKQSSAQITKRYRIEDLMNRQVIAVINFPVKPIAGFKSECLVLGVLGDAGDVILLQPESQVKNGSRIA
ncbi:MAG: tRNA-binding protein [Bacteroidia bacterium]|jgi:tRNA-binding protein